MNKKTKMLFTALVVSALTGGASQSVQASERLKEGKEVAKACKACHGINGIAQIPIAPHLAGENSIYLQTQLKAFRIGKRHHEIMSVIAEDMTDQEIEDVAAWYSSIKISVEVPEIKDGD